MLIAPKIKVERRGDGFNVQAWYNKDVAPHDSFGLMQDIRERFDMVNE
jgi:hypothetical protein